MTATNAVKDARLWLQFWGVRGSTPTPTAANLGYGGNTTCIEIESRSGARIIIDCGSGAINLGRQLIEKGNLDLHLFLTHFHWDHIQGIPFFAPLLTAGNKVTFYSFPTAEEIRVNLHRQMSSPYFTLDFSRLAGTREYRQLSKEAIQFADMRVTSFPLHHPQGAYGYRVECDGASIVIATDVEHGSPELDLVLREHSEGADVLIYDAQYTPAEYAVRQGWGHSTYEAAVRVAKDANVKQLVLFHHDPTHDDKIMDEIVELASRLFRNVVAAREQCTIAL